MQQESKIMKVNNWHEINWKEAYSRVEEIQQKIVEATLTKNMQEVWRLQRKLVMTFDAKALAVRKVITNEGRKTAGVDGDLWDSPKKKFEAIDRLGEITNNPNKYKASPVMRITIPKKGSKVGRNLGIPTMIDRAVQAVYHMAVDPVVECNSDLNSYGFRKHRATTDAITTIRVLLDKAVSPRWILETDIAKCFDKINHEYLISKTPMADKHVLRQMLKSGISVKGKLEKSLEGTPQGGVISPMLCNVALNGMEATIRKFFEKSRDKVDKITGERSKVNVIRYADDLIITGSSKEILVKAKAELERFLRPIGLELKEGKTRLNVVDIGFEFLGFHIRRKRKNRHNSLNMNLDTVLVIEPTKGAIQNVKDEIKEAVKKEKSIKSILRKLNPILRGWTEYYRISAHSKEAFKEVGNFLWETMRNWAKSKHLGITDEEVMRKYVIKGKSHKWMWGANDKEVLLNPATVSSWTLRPIKLDKNPYLLENKDYFEKRKELRSASKFRSIIYKKFNYKCIVCNQELQNGEPIELDHIIPKKDGGTYVIENIRPLHQECHRKITYSVWKQEPDYQSEDMIDEQFV